ncbi:ER membrane glycoprotein subunit of the GPI transamidase complex-like protein [Polyrhizophydium stewartii]|uniref:GPI mannosyltransferase 2 n=1 Tax=Polyrhizophydium stewartii TaxID=2732419 RepID=A0ABR4NEM0_9FUNG
MAAALARPLVRWDAVHFVDIAAGGHHFEQQFAFFPGLPLLARALAAPAVAAGVLCRSAALPLAGIVVANASFVAAAVALHRLSLAVLQDRRAARAAAMLFCVNPAGIFMSSVYTESPFALLTFVGMLAMVRGNRLVAAMSWSLATAVRANGILAAGFFVWDAVHPFARQHRSMVSEQPDAATQMQAAAHCALDMLGAAATIAPFVGFQALGWHQFCGSAASPRPWCSRPLPSIYAFVQEHYWDNGFLRYFTPQQAPNFVLAAPIVAISVAGIAHFARQNPAAVLTLGLESSSSAAVLVRLPFVVLWATMLVLCVTSMNVQVIIRFFTSVPAMFWFLGEAVAAHARGRRLSVPVRAALLYFVLYPLAGAVLFSRFLPPA